MQAQGPLDKATIQDARKTDGVAKVAPVTTATGTIEGGGDAKQTTIQGVSSEFSQVVRNDSATKGLDSTHAVGSVPGASDGDKITVTVKGNKVNLTLVGHGQDTQGIVVTQDVMTKLAPKAEPTQLQVRYKDGADQSKTTQALSKSMSAHQGVTVASTADQKAQMDKVINILLSMVVGLLVISVIIAMVGVANTLGLSVVERTREIGLLRYPVAVERRSSPPSPWLRSELKGWRHHEVHSRPRCCRAGMTRSSSSGACLTSSWQ